MLRALSVLMVLPVCFLQSGCFDEEEPYDPYGVIAFDWRFDGIDTCADAGVDEVDVVVLQNGQVMLSIEREPCVGGGLEIADIYEGQYEVQIDAYDRESYLLYAGSFSIDVRGGKTNNAGIVNLDAIGDEPLPATGSVMAYWGFQYPTDSSLNFDCAAAGVQDVDVIVTPVGAGEAIYVDTFACADEGVNVDLLAAGAYTLQFVAYGTYANNAIALYDSGEIRFDVDEGATNELADVLLRRVADTFADFSVRVSFGEETCASMGVTTLHVELTREGNTTPDDTFDVACTPDAVLRPVFVPAGYTVVARATVHPGTPEETTLQNSVSALAAPGALVDVTVALGFAP